MDSITTVILCGGKGTRSYPFTAYFPKVMMPINGTPIIVHLMQIYAAQGFTRFVLAAGWRKEMLFDYFRGRFPEWDINIVDTGEEADTGERIHQCQHLVGDTFFATYGDGLGDVDLHGLLDHHRQCNGLATLTTVPLRSQYGIVMFDGESRVSDFREKPVIKDCWMNAGFFAIQKQAFDRWKGTNLEADVLPGFASDGRLYTYQHNGFWKSMDTSKDQQELEKLFTSGRAPWTPEIARTALAG